MICDQCKIPITADRFIWYYRDMSWIDSITGIPKGKTMCGTCASCLYPRVSGNLTIRGVAKRRTPLVPNIAKGERTIGFEFEGNWPLNALERFYNEPCEIKDDGSLRGLDAAEIAVDPMLSTEYADWLANSPISMVNTYSRCGIHEWFGVEDYSWYMMNQLLFFCVYHARELVACLPSTRVLSNARVPAGTPMGITWVPKLYSKKSDFLYSLYGTDQLRDGTKNRSKMQASKRANDNREGPAGQYKGPINRTWWLNAHAFFFKRCIEVRLLHTTPVWQTIVAWTELWLRILNKVPNMNKAELKYTRISDLAPSVSRFLLSDKLKVPSFTSPMKVITDMRTLDDYLQKAPYAFSTRGMK